MKTSGKSWARYIDKSIKAKKVGYRKSSVTGERYYEARPDHSDENPKERYARGGTLTISDIKERTKETAPYYFSKATMKAFGQTMRDFKVKKMPNGKYLMYAPMKDRSSGRMMGYSMRMFNPETNKLDFLTDAEAEQVKSKYGIHKYLTSYEDGGMMAKGGITEHGLEIGDKITGRGHGDKIEGYNKEMRETFTTDLDKGKRSSIRYAKGGSVISQFKVTSGRGGGKETWIISHPKIEDKGVYFKSDYTESEAKNDWYKNVFQKYEKGFYAKGGKTKKDPPIVRGYFDDEPYEYGNGGQLSLSDRLPVGKQTDAERELELFINNDSGLYRRRKHPIEINLAKKIASGKFDINQAPKIFKYLIDDGIKQYTKLYGGIKLTKQEKDNLAKEFVNEFLSNASEGSFDEYIPKKYQMAKGGLLSGFNYSIGGL